MNRKTQIGMLIAATALLSGGLWWMNRGDEAETADGPRVELEHASERLQASPLIPDGKGGLTEEGKFVPPATEQTVVRAVTRDEAESKLKQALKVEDLGSGKFQIGRVKFDRNTRELTIPARVNMRQGVVEYALTTEFGKRHEAMLTTDASPQDLHLAFLLLGKKAATLRAEVGSTTNIKPEESVEVSVSWETNGPTAVHPLSSLVSLTKGNPQEPGEAMATSSWHYTGSRFTGPGGFAAQLEGGLISLINDSAALINNPSSSRENDDIHVPNGALLPADGVPVTVHFRLP